MIDRTYRQEVGIQKWVDNNCKGSLEWATGVGKTRAGLLAINRFLKKNENGRITIIVPTEVLQKQWIVILAKEGLVFNIDVLIINSAIKRVFIADLLILDEAHRYGAPLFSKIFEMCSPPMVLGLTATFERLDGMHEVISKYAPIIDTITVAEATANGWLSEYKEYKVILKVDNLNEYLDWNQQFLNHFSFFNFDFKLAMTCVTGIKIGTKTVESGLSVRKRYALHMLGGNMSDRVLLDNTLKEVAAHAFGWQKALKARKDFVMNHPKKVEIAKLILEHREESKAILFTSSIKQSESFKNCYVVHSGNTKKKNGLSLEEFAGLESGVIASSKMLTEGLDCPGLNLAIILHNTSSPTERIQRLKVSTNTFKFL